MKILKLLLFTFLILSLNVSAQNDNKKSFTLKRFLKKTPWTFNIGGHVIDDDGNPFSNLFNVSKSWNFLPFPSRISVDAYLKNGWCVQSEFAYTIFKAGKEINNHEIKNSYSFFSTDINARYQFNKILGEIPWFCPYLAGGLGYTYNPSVGTNYRNTATANLGIGFNFWIYENLGINLNSMAKFSMVLNNTNYLHHSIGVIYRYKRNMGNRPGRIGNRYSFLKSKF